MWPLHTQDLGPLLLMRVPFTSRDLKDTVVSFTLSTMVFVLFNPDAQSKPSVKRHVTGRRLKIIKQSYGAVHSSTRNSRVDVGRNRLFHGQPEGDPYRH